MELDIATLSAPRLATENRAMAITAATARILLGLVFFAAGLSGYLMVLLHAPLPPQTGLAGAFQDVFFRSHWVLFVDGVEFVGGVLLLANRYMTLALTLLGAVISNILYFHLSMQPQTIAVPLVVLALWTVLAWRFRSGFAPLFVQKAQPVSRHT